MKPIFNPITGYFRWLKQILLQQDRDFRNKVLNVLGLAGILIAVVTVIAEFVTRGTADLLSYAIMIPLVAILLYTANKTGRWRLCCSLVGVFIFGVIFTLIFFRDAGYHNGMPAYLVFAAVFTIFMLDGKLGLIMSGIELALYVSLCSYAYFHPESVPTLKNE
jgi:FtsH-binding integral membrane protein